MCSRWNTNSNIVGFKVHSTKERADLSRIFSLLTKNGADLNYISPNYNKVVYEQYKNEPVCEFLRDKIKMENISLM